MLGFSSSDDADGKAVEAGEEIVVPEATAAFLVRERAVDIIEVIDAPDSEPETDQGAA